ncbi:hypothetical protein GN956_G8243 [Arapaima gigas]
MTDSGQDRSLKEFVLLLSQVLFLWAPGIASQPSLARPTGLPPVLPAPMLTQKASLGGRAVELLCRAPSGYAGVIFKLYKERNLVNSTMFEQDTPEARFHVVRERGTRWKSYCCLYQNSIGVYSVFSPYLELRASTRLLQAPTLSLVHQPSEDGARLGLLCRGSPQYHSAVFSLHHPGSSRTLATKSAPLVHNSVHFSLPTHHQHMDQYQCQYSVMVDKEWNESERSLPLAVPVFTEMAMNTTPPSQPPTKEHPGDTDWPMITGSISAIVLIMVVLTLLGFMMHWKGTCTMTLPANREEARFWHHMHSLDHVVGIIDAKKFSSFLGARMQEWDPAGDGRASGAAKSCNSSASDPHFYTFRNSVLH